MSSYTRPYEVPHRFDKNSVIDNKKFDSFADPDAGLEESNTGGRAEIIKPNSILLEDDIIDD